MLTLFDALKNVIALLLFLLVLQTYVALHWKREMEKAKKELLILKSHHLTDSFRIKLLQRLK